MHVYESIRNYDKLIQGGPKMKTLSRIIIESFELTPEDALTSFTTCTLWVRQWSN